MVNKIAKAIIGTTVIIVVVWGAIQLIPTEEKRIEKQLHHVASLLSFTGQEGNIAHMAAANALGNCFTPKAAVVLEDPSIGPFEYHGNQQIQQTALAVMSSDRGIHVEFDDPVITVAPDRQTATADLTAKVTVTGDRDINVEELHLSLQKIDAKWRISRVESLKTFGK